MTKEEICKDIEALWESRMTSSNCSNLANLLIIKDHMEKNGGNMVDEHSWDVEITPKERSGEYKVRAMSGMEDDSLDLDIHAPNAEDDALAIHPAGKSRSNATSESTTNRTTVEHPKLTRDMAMEWASYMENVDGTTGAHWTIDKTNQVMAQKGLHYDPTKFFLALNATYSDFSKCFRKHGINSIDAYVDFAVAFWLDDKDAVEDKLAAYYTYVVKH